jgi:SRSO17 transposase
VVLVDAGYAMHRNFRSELKKLEIAYVAGIQSTTTVWKPGEQPEPEPARKGESRPAPQTVRAGAQHQPISVPALAQSLPAVAWRKVICQQGVKQKLRSRFATLRIRPAHRDYWRSQLHHEEWLLIEWPTEKEVALALHPRRQSWASNQAALALPTILVAEDGRPVQAIAP